MAHAARFTNGDDSETRARTHVPDEATAVQGRTTIELYTTESARWLATQRGVDVVGRGATAARVVGEYCRKLDRQEHD